MTTLLDMRAPQVNMIAPRNSTYPITINVSILGVVDDVSNKIIQFAVKSLVTDLDADALLFLDNNEIGGIVDLDPTDGEALLTFPPGALSDYTKFPEGIPAGVYGIKLQPDNIEVVRGYFTTSSTAVAATSAS